MQDPTGRRCKPARGLQLLLLLSKKAVSRVRPSVKMNSRYTDRAWKILPDRNLFHRK